MFFDEPASSPDGEEANAETEKSDPKATPVSGKAPRAVGTPVATPWRRIVELARRIDDQHRATGTLDFDAVVKLADTVLLFHVRLLGGFSGGRRPGPEPR